MARYEIVRAVVFYDKDGYPVGAMDLNPHGFIRASGAAVGVLDFIVFNPADGQPVGRSDGGQFIDGILAEFRSSFLTAKEVEPSALPDIIDKPDSRRV